MSQYFELPMFTERDKRPPSEASLVTMLNELMTSMCQRRTMMVRNPDGRVEAIMPVARFLFKTGNVGLMALSPPERRVDIITAVIQTVPIFGFALSFDGYLTTGEFEREPKDLEDARRIIRTLKNKHRTDAIIATAHTRSGCVAAKSARYEVKDGKVIFEPTQDNADMIARQNYHSIYEGCFMGNAQGGVH
jgi:hypothetical protein